MIRKMAVMAVIVCQATFAGVALMTTGTLAAEEPGVAAISGQSTNNSNDIDPDCTGSRVGSPYIPVDSWVYPAVLRLYSLGYVDTVYLGLRPWTRANLSHMLDEVSDRIDDSDETSVTR